MDQELLIPVRLSKEGFGTPEQIAAMRTDLVVAALTYSNFSAEYEETVTELNREK
jgi:hypothetical protein